MASPPPEIVRLLAAMNDVNSPNPPLEFRCPFCGVRAICVVEPIEAVFHTLPMCKRFQALEPEEYMAAVNDHLLAELAKRPEGSA